MAPHVTMWIVARRINIGLQTRTYFSDETEANAVDPVLARIEHRHRMETLIALPVDGGYQFDIHCRATGRRSSLIFDGVS